MADDSNVGPDAPFEAAVSLHQEGRHEDAADAYRAILEETPHHAGARTNLAQALGAMGRVKEAEAAYRAILDDEPRAHQVWFNLGNLLRRAGRLKEAEDAFREAIAIDGGFAPSYLNLGHTLRDGRRWNDAAGRYRAFIERQAGNAEAHENLGRCLQNLNQPADALAEYRAAEAAGGANAFLFGAMGIVEEAFGHMNEAKRHFDRAVEADPESAAAWSNLGAALQRLGDTAHASRCLDKAIALDPDYSMAHANLGWILRDQHRLDEAIVASRRALAAEPGLAIAYANLGSALMIQTRQTEAFEAYAKALELDPGNEATWSSYLFALNYRDDLTPAEVVRAHRDWGARIAGFEYLAAEAQHREPDWRLVIGYVSPDFRDHPVGLLVEPIIAHHDRVRFEVRCYSHGTQVDATTWRIRAAADAWVETGDLDDAAAAQRIHADGVDILVDLSGHTAGNRLGVFAHKPAPVQVSYAGYVTTTGLDAMDWVVHDAVTRVSEAEAEYAERLLTLGACLYCYRPPEVAPPVAPAPLAKKGFITFGSFNNTPKLTAATFDLWGAALQRVPNSRFVLKAGAMRDAGARERVTAALSARGVAGERLDLVPPTTFDEHLADYGRIDIALDPAPFTGGITSLQALWQGVPFVTFKGASHAARVGASILTTAGLGDLIAETPEDYAAIAAALASDTARVADLRQTMRERLAPTTLIDGAAFTAEFERALVKAWDESASWTTR
jgi:predicted O-linked N-acetylglucosamine transferase (SPINDLY family)